MKNNYYVKNDLLYIEIKNRQGLIMTTVIDADNFDKVNMIKGHWTTMEVGNHGVVYVYGYLNGKTISLHRYLMDSPSGKVIDHINHDTLNNTIENLRVLSQGENLQNQKGASKNSKSGVRGVYWDKTKNLWLAQYRLNGKAKNLGRFKTIEEAKEVVERERKKYMKFSN